MRRVALLAGCLGLLASCAGAPSMPVEQVLQKATRAVQDLQSVRFDAHAKMQGATPLGANADLALAAKGWTQQERKQLQSSVAVEGTSDGKPLRIEADVIIAGDDEIYVNTKSISSEDPESPLRSPFFNLLLNQWLRLPSEQSEAAGGITPDPRLLDLQTQSIRVTRDRGMKTMNGRMSYYYDIEIDREKMQHFLEEVAQERKEPFDAEAWKKSFDEVSMSGSAWIDAETFQLNRLAWKMESKAEGDLWTLTFDVSFSDHNKAPVIKPPEGAKEMPSLLDMLSQGAGTVPGSLPAGMPPEMQRRLLESLLNPR